MLHVQWKTDVFPFEPEQIYREIFVLLSATKMKAFVMTSQVKGGWLQGQITDFIEGKKKKRQKETTLCRNANKMIIMCFG